MRRILPIALVLASTGTFAQSGFAADIPARAARVAPVAAPVYAAFSWTGCYVGANLGFGNSPRDWTVTGIGVSAGSHDATGIVGGGQAGCDLQTGNLVFGFEGMFDWSGMNDSHSIAGVNLQTDVNWLATLTGRAGWAVDRALFYVKGGAAWTDDDYAITALGATASANDVTRSGWTVGGGLEWSFAPAWSAKLEYNYMDFGSETPRFCLGGACGRAFNIDQSVHLFTVGLNYRFWGN